MLKYSSLRILIKLLIIKIKDMCNYYIYSSRRNNHTTIFLYIVDGSILFFIISSRPHFVEQVHKGIIDHESYAYIQTHSAQTRYRPFIKSKKKRKEIISFKYIFFFMIIVIIIILNIHDAK